MNIWSQLKPVLLAALPLLGGVAVFVVLLWFVNWLLLRRKSELGAEAKLPRQILMLITTIVGLVIVIAAVPMSESTRGNILGLIGIMLTGIIALSSTNFTGNIMAGLMLRVIKSFHSGDFIQIGEQFGRVTERGLVHTEIQNENRNLITFPNLYLVTQPMTVVRGSGTIVSTSLSLGYDIPRPRIEDSLLRAAIAAGLTDPFVRINELGDYAVTYRIAGLLEDVKRLLSVRSDLRKSVMDTLHNDGIEIVSPTIMNQRPLPPGRTIIPPGPVVGSSSDGGPPSAVPEALIFDKAEDAEALERLQKELEGARRRIEELRKEGKGVEKEQQERLQREIEALEGRCDQLERQIAAAEKRKREREDNE